MKKLLPILRRLLPAALAAAAMSLSSCETYVADGYAPGAYGGGYGSNSGYCAPVSSTVYVAPRSYCAPTYYGSSCYTPSYYSPAPRYYSGSCDVGYGGGYHSGGGYGYGSACR